MKKIILTIALAVVMVVSASAQKAGDQNIGVSFGYETSKNTFVVSTDSNSTTQREPAENSISVGLEYNRFLVDNLRVGFGVSYRTVRESGSDDNVNTTIIAPSVSYYFPMAKNLYYTPGVSAGYATINNIEKRGDREYKENYNGYIVGVSLLAFEYRYSERLAVNLNVGTFQYSSLSQKEDDITYTSNSAIIDVLANASVGVSLYF